MSLRKRCVVRELSGTFTDSDTQQQARPLGQSPLPEPPSSTTMSAQTPRHPNGPKTVHPTRVSRLCDERDVVTDDRRR
jgi:hypothetical protein